MQVFTDKCGKRSLKHTPERHKKTNKGTSKVCKSICRTDYDPANTKKKRNVERMVYIKNWHHLIFFMHAFFLNVIFAADQYLMHKYYLLT